MAITLNDYMNLIKDPFSLGLFKRLYRMNDILKLFPVTEVGAMVVRGQRWSVLPTQGFRAINEDYTDSEGQTEPEEDRLAIWGGTWSSDEVLKKFPKEVLYRDPMEQQFIMHLKAMDRGIANALINGDVNSNPESFNGLEARFASGKFNSACDIELESGNSFLVLASAANATAFFDALDSALYETGLFMAGEVGTARGAILLNKTSFLGIQKAARLTGLNLLAEDQIGHRWLTYRGIPFVDIGLQVDQSTDIILDTYDPGDSGDDSTRIYVVRFADAPPAGNAAQAAQAIENPGADGLTLVQAGGFEKLDPHKTTIRKVQWGLEWVLGIAHVGDDRCVAKLDNLEFSVS